MRMPQRSETSSAAWCTRCESSQDPQSIGYFDPLKALQLVGNVLAGVSGEEERAAPSRGAGGGSGGSGADAAGVVRGDMAHTIAQSRGNERLLPHNMGRS